MVRALVIFMVLVSFHCNAQYVRIITYASGKPQYIINFENDLVQRTVCLSPNGDTVYSWDIKKCIFNDYPITGQYLTSAEYRDFRNQLFAKHNLSDKDTAEAFISLTPPAPAVSEWKMMHDHFFKVCPVYTMIIHEGDFTISTEYKNKLQDGVFKKYYRGLLVVRGQYKNGNRYGMWNYYPYPYYPYDDIIIMNIAGKDFSIMYSLLPSFILIVFFLIIGIYTTKYDTYHFFFYTIMLLATAALLLRLYLPYDRQNVWVKEFVPAIWFTLWHTMILLSVINLFFSRRTKPPVIINMICLLLGLSFSIFVIFFKHLNF